MIQYHCWLIGSDEGKPQMAKALKGVAVRSFLLRKGDDDHFVHFTISVDHDAAYVWVAKNGPKIWEKAMSKDKARKLWKQAEAKGFSEVQAPFASGRVSVAAPYSDVDRWLSPVIAHAR